MLVGRKIANLILNVELSTSKRHTGWDEFNPPTSQYVFFVVDNLVLNI
jgi:hypothetical protein